jgi:hypothetical protein
MRREKRTTNLLRLRFWRVLVEVESRAVAAGIFLDFRDFPLEFLNLQEKESGNSAPTINPSEDSLAQPLALIQLLSQN